MKKILIAALMMLAMVACNKDDKEKAMDITGDWNITKITTKSAVIGDVTVDVWISFKSDKTFMMYQKIGLGRYTSFSGSWSLAGNKLTGKYSDGKLWASDYEAVLEDSGKTLILTSSKGEIDTFKKGSIPTDILTR